MSDLRGPSSPPPPALQPGQAPTMADPFQVNDMLQAHYGKVKETHGLLDKIRVELDGALKLGEAIEPDDIVQAVGRMVGHGVAATTMAEIMATMPQTAGAPLLDWLRQQDLTVRLNEARTQFMRNHLQHAMAVNGLKMLALEHLRGGAPTGPQQPISSGASSVDLQQGSPSGV